MTLRIDFQARMVFTQRWLATALGLKADISVVASRIPSNEIEDSPNILISPDTRASVPPHSRGLKLLEGKDE